MNDRPCRVLMVYPRFASDSFWVYTPACEIVGARYPTAPLGMITVAAMLPSDWEVRLINRNTEDLADGDLEWADMVMTGGMLFQQADSLRITAMAHALGKPVVVGGPDVSSHPYVYKACDFQILGEAESVIDAFLAAWQAGQRSGVFEGEKFQVDVTKTPIPRFDLLKFDQYLYIGVQFSRGCPFTCEFCDIIELYGRNPRAKTNAQMLAELDRLYELGYRGHVDFVDDNLIGNKKAVKAFLPHLKTWLEQHDYPFEFSTEASLNLADDEELLRLMRDANFFAVFVGIESPDTETLMQMRKKQNTRRNIAESVHQIYAHGMFITAGFIVGFDSEKGSIAEPMIELIEEAAVPIAMVGLLYAYSTTQLGRRLAKERRLHEGHDLYETGDGDHCTAGLNFDTLRPRNDVLRDYKQILDRIYDPEAFAGRLKRLADLVDRSRSRRRPPAGDIKNRASATVYINKILDKMLEHREIFQDALKYCAETNPLMLRFIVPQMAIYLHLGPFSRKVIAVIDRQISASQETAKPDLVASQTEGSSLYA
ncbi:MAG: radical SAM protein [Hyphomicrobiales bacterium]